MFGNNTTTLLEDQPHGKRAATQGRGGTMTEAGSRRAPPPEHEAGKRIEVWRHGDNVVACDIIEEIGRGAQAVVYRAECEGATRALKAARVLPVVEEARAMLRA